MTARDEFVDWTNVTSNLLLSRIPEDLRGEIAGWLAVYQRDVRTAAIRDAEEAIDSARAAMDAADPRRRGLAFASGVVRALHPAAPTGKEA